MALEVLKDVKDIGGFEVVVMDDLRESMPELFPEALMGQMDYVVFERDIRTNKFVYIRNDKNSITFNLQSGPVKEVGVNGCQIDTIIEAAKILIEKHNQIYPCYENVRALYSLKDALGFLAERKAKREARGVEGTSEQ